MMSSLASLTLRDSRTGWLPIDVLYHVFSHLDSPLDLQRASLVAREWRAAAIDPRLWEAYYWAFYRAPTSSQSGEDRLLLARQERGRTAELRGWVERIQSGASSIPAFVGPRVNPHSARERLPDFHSLFVKRINDDDRLVRDICVQVELAHGALDNVLQLVERYGESARDFLFALCADQQLTRGSIGQLSSSSTASVGNSGNQSWPRAFAVHKRAASQSPELSTSHCLALHHTAYQILGHLQRREAIRAIQQLQERFSASASLQPQTLKQRVLRSTAAIEEALTALSLFHFGDAREFSRYLDLLALYVWAEIDADAQNHPRPSTTRSSILRIELALHHLGFRITGEVDENDLANFFPNVALFCPAQRAASDIAFSGILCAVCCRLGVAACPTNTPAWILVVEEGQRPEDWEGLEQDWEKFYLLPDREQRRHRIDSEASVVEQDVRNTTAEERDGSSIEDYLKPASPLKILHYAGARISNALSPDGSAGPLYDRPVRLRSSPIPLDEQVNLLRDYLCGHTALPPQPLAPAALPSSLALLPPTRANFPRFSSLALRQDARYCCIWSVRLLAPETMGGVGEAEDLLSEVLAEASHLRSDVALLLEVNGCNVQTQLGLTRHALRQASRGEAIDLSGFDYVAITEPPQAVRNYVSKFFACDIMPSTGLGGSGGGERGSRERQLLNPAHPRNAAVQHGVGTVFTHRSKGFRAVVFGWDSTFKADAKIEATDRSPRGGLDQPFYYAWGENGELAYVAQSNVEAARVPAGSTGEEAAAMLGEFLRLFKLRKMGICFQSVEVAPWKKSEGKSSGSRKKGCSTSGKKKGGVEAGGKEGGEIKMVMNPWMREGWPFG